MAHPWLERVGIIESLVVVTVVGLVVEESVRFADWVGVVAGLVP